MKYWYIAYTKEILYNFCYLYWSCSVKFFNVGYRQNI